MDFRSRIVFHAEKVRNLEEMDAAMVGVFDQVAEAKKEKFEALAKNVIKPAFEEFKAILRQIGRDAVITSNLAHETEQSMRLILVDRYLKFGMGKTLNLVNPKDDIVRQSNTKFYEVSRADELVFIKERAVTKSDPITTQVTYEELTPAFFENELARFFERAYPTTS